MKQRRPLPGWISPLIAFLFLGCIAVTLMSATRERPPGDEAVARVQKAVRRAAVQCFALEGAYPPDLAYLEDNYSLMVDTTRFYCELVPMGANVMPDILVRPLGGASG